MNNSNTIEIDCSNGDITYCNTEQSEQERPEFDYDTRVAELIRQHYTIDSEFAILRQRQEKMEQYEYYFMTCELCKEQARKERDEYNQL